MCKMTTRVKSNPILLSMRGWLGWSSLVEYRVHKKRIDELLLIATLMCVLTYNLCCLSNSLTKFNTINVYMNEMLIK